VTEAVPKHSGSSPPFGVGVLVWSFLFFFVFFFFCFPLGFLRMLVMLDAVFRESRARARAFFFFFPLRGAAVERVS